MPGAGRALRGGGLALRRDRGQHARHLRGREGPAAGRDARAVRDGQPHPPHLRSRVRADRRHRAGAAELRAGGRAGAAGGARPDDPRPCSRSASTSRSPRPSTRGRSSAGEEALKLADELGDVPAQIELHAALGRLAVHSAGWAEVRARAAASGELAEREGLSGQLCLPLFLEGVTAWQRGRVGATPSRASGEAGRSRSPGADRRSPSSPRSGPEPVATTGASSAAPRRLWRKPRRSGIGPA